MSKEYLRKCVKCGRQRSEDMSITYHKFPKLGKRNKTKAQAWAKYCWPELDWSSDDLLRSLYQQHKVLCGRHFTDDQFYDNKRQVLSLYAVPGSSKDRCLEQVSPNNLDLNGENNSLVTAEDNEKKTADKENIAGERDKEEERYIEEVRDLAEVAIAEEEYITQDENTAEERDKEEERYIEEEGDLAKVAIAEEEYITQEEEDIAEVEKVIVEEIVIDDSYRSTKAIIIDSGVVTGTAQLLISDAQPNDVTCADSCPDYDKLCRACLSRDQTKPMPEELFDMFLDVTGLLSEDCIPKVMCDVCERRLKDSSEFRNQCLQNNQWFIDKIQIKSKDSNNGIQVNNSIENDNIAACIENTDNGTVNTEIGLMNTENESSMKTKTRPLNLQRRKKIYVRVLDRCTNKLKPAPGHVVPHVIKEFMEKMKYRPLNYNLKPSIKKTNLIPRTISQTKKAKKRLNPEQEEYYSDESDSNCCKITDIKRKKGKHNIEASPIDKQVEAIDHIDKNNEMKSSDKTENIEEQKENEQSYNLHRDLVFDHKVLENTQLLLSTFFIRRKLSLEEQKNQILKMKTFSSYLRRTYKCDLCYHGFIQKAAYDSHMIKHTSNAGNFTCEICYIHFHTKKSLMKHMSDLHRFFYQCKYCTKSFYNKKKAISHIQEMHSTKLFKCDKCDYKVKALGSLYTHKRLKHPCKYFCKFCGYSFVSAYGLNIHLDTKHRFIEQQSTTEEIYCFRCDITFMNKEAYETHKRVSFQHGECVAPNIESRKHSSKNVNERKHTKKVMCEWCGLELTKSLAFRSHIRRAHPEKYELDTTRTEYSLCEICGKNVRHGYLLTHCKNVHNFIPKTIECEVCHMRFRWRKNRNKHFKARHYEEYLAKNKKRNEQKRMINVNDDDSD